MTKVYQELANAIGARLYCIANGNMEWITKWETNLHVLEDTLGSGIDCGCQVDLEKSTVDKIVIQVPYHNMDDDGRYIGWTYYEVTITPTLFLPCIHVDVNGDDDMTCDIVSDRIRNAMLEELTKNDQN